MFVLMVILVSLSTNVTSVRLCKPTLDDCGTKGRTCVSAGVCDNKYVGDECGTNKVCVEVCRGIMFGNAMFACCGCSKPSSVGSRISSGCVTPTFASTGAASGHVADLTITSNADEVLIVPLKPSDLDGMLLLNPNGGEQNLVIARVLGVSTGPTTYRLADNVTINPGESVTFPVEGYCADMSKKNPTEGTTLTLGDLVEPEVQLVIYALEDAEFPENFAPEDVHSLKQIAIWMSQPENADNTPEDYAQRGYPIRDEYKPVLDTVLSRAGAEPEEIFALSGKRKEESKPPEKPPEEFPWIYAAAAVAGILVVAGGTVAIWGIYKITSKK